MKLLSKITTVCALAAACVLFAVNPVKAEEAVPSQVLFLQQQMAAQQAEIAKINAYFALQEARAKAEQRNISDIEMVKRQALEGIITGDNQLLQMGNTVLPYSQAYPLGAGNIALMDQAAYEGYVSGMAALEEVKKNTWMTYTFRLH